MSYRIRYYQKSKKVGIINHQKNIFFLVFITAFLIVVAGFFKVQIVSVLIPGNDVVTKSAYQAFREELDEGEAFGVAFEVFCKEILEHAQ